MFLGQIMIGWDITKFLFYFSTRSSSLRAFSRNNKNQRVLSMFFRKNASGAPVILLEIVSYCQQETVKRVPRLS